MKRISLTITLGLIAMLCVAALHRNCQIECVRYDYNFKKRINGSNMISYLEEKFDEDKRRKDEEDAQRRYRIFQVFL
jgi:hypothetical protein